MENSSDFIAIIKVLTEHNVEFIVVGGLGAVFHGVPIMTFDIDIVHSREDKNLDRLIKALNILEAQYREQPERRLKPTKDHLASPGHQLLLTNKGPLDILGTIGKDLSFDELTDKTDRFQLETEMEVRVLKLKTIIEIKEYLGSEKDKAVLPILKRTLDEKTREW